MRVAVVLAVVAALAVGLFVGSRYPAQPATPAANGAQQSTTSTTSTTSTSSTGIPASATEATIEYVYDGDTLFLTDGRKVRLLGINTPEIGDNPECWGDEATALLRQLLPEGTHVWVLPDIDPLDKYGRSLLFIYRDDATNINLELLRQGAAEVEMYAPNLLYQQDVEQAEAQARAANVGMWASC
ncbi:MAG: thermonuclease [Rhodoglobus sp.]|nr:thermonuclease [Rhodoglobus sp.]